MHKKIKLIVLCIFLFISYASAQPGSISVSGKVTASDDQLPIPYTSVGISGKGIGTSTNINGLYSLIIPVANGNDTLNFSCIGFKTKKVAINQLKKGGQLNIVLVVNNTELKEVKVAYHDAPKIIRKAIESIGDNYLNTAHILRGFYRMYAFNAQKPLQLSEAVFDVYNFGYGDKHADLFRLLKARNEKNLTDFGDVDLAQKPNSIFEADVVNHLNASGFLNSEGLSNHIFEVNGLIDYKGIEAYVVTFKEKPGTGARTFRGRMYISTKTNAFLHFEFGLSPAMLREAAQGNFATRTVTRAGNVKLGLTRDSTVVNYQQMDGKWVLADVTVNNKLTITRPGKAASTAQVRFNYQVTAVDINPKETFEGKIGRNESINSHATNPSASFWKDYTIVLSDNDTEDVFKQIQLINNSK